MRRLVLICMMLLLPVQWTWAAAAVYCAHESSPAAARHFGHHEHVHKASGATHSKHGQANQAGALDLDCEYCHLAGSQWLPSQHALVSIGVRTAPAVEDPPRVGSHISAGPERPDRALDA